MYSMAKIFPHFWRGWNKGIIPIIALLKWPGHGFMADARFLDTIGVMFWKVTRKEYRKATISAII